MAPPVDLHQYIFIAACVPPFDMLVGASSFFILPDYQIVVNGISSSVANLSIEPRLMKSSELS
jgi:hypothetical protein